ncbi:MAG: DNA internalization-related competence protein ComEC/Rec2 [Acidobacteriota bacterium]
MAFPFLFIALFFASGIFFSSLFQIPLSILLVFLLLSVLSAWLYLTGFRKNKPAFAFLLISTFLLGASFYTHFNARYEKNPLHQFKEEAYIDIKGVLYKSPSFSNDQIHLHIKTKEITSHNRTEKIRGNIRISIPQTQNSNDLRSLWVHDLIKVSAKVSPSQGYQNFGLLPSNTYLKFRKIHQTGFSKSPLLVEKLSSGSDFSLLRMISKVRQELQKKIEAFFPEKNQRNLSSSGAVMEALLLGERGRMSESLSRSLQDSGLYHLFAISGAHIAIISFLIFSVLKFLKVPERTSYIVLIFFLVFYSLLVEGRPSIIRATIMTLTFLIGRLIWKDSNLLNTLSLSAFILLLFNPFHLFSLGFQMTFAATLSIVLFFPLIIKYLPSLPLNISEILTLSLTAQLGVLPITASAFNRIAFAPLILNLIALPLISIIMAAGYVFIPIAFISSITAQLMVKLIDFLINILISISHLASSVNFLSYRIPDPHTFTVLGTYVFLLAFLWPKKIKKQKLIISLLFAGFFIVLITYPFPSYSKHLQMTFFDVGNGDSILVEFPGKKKMLVDGGGSAYRSFDIGERIVSPLLWDKGIKKIDYLVLTHAHPDHLYGLFSVVKNFRIKQFWESVSPREAKAYWAFKRNLNSKTLQKKFFQGASLKIGQVAIEVLYPQKPENPPLSAHNNQSLVMKLTYHQTSFLLTGDAEYQAEQKILSHYHDIESKVLKSPHHGSCTSSTPSFIKAVSPQIVVISVGKNNWYSLPDKNVIHRYENIGAEVYRTDHHGAVRIVSDGKSLSVTTAAQKSSGNQKDNPSLP